MKIMTTCFKGVLILFCMCIHTTITAQSVELEWAGKMGGTTSDMGNAIAVDASGNVYVTGSYSASAANFDMMGGTTTLTPKGGTDIFVCKLTSTGGLIWAKSMGGTGADVGYDIAVDASGNVYVVGNVFAAAGTLVNLDPNGGTLNITGKGSNDAVVCKLSASGNLLWAKNMGGTGADVGNKLAVDISGNVYVAGNFSGTANFNTSGGTTNLMSAGSTDAFVCKLNSSGDLDWAKGMGGSSVDAGSGIALDASGNVIVSGHFFGTATFDAGSSTTLASRGSTDIYIAKFDAAGNFTWVKQMGGTKGDQPRCIALDASGNIYTSGYFTESANFDPNGTVTLTGIGAQDIFISKLNASGNLVWAKSIGGILPPGGGGEGAPGFYGESIAVDAGQKVYLTGRFEGTTDFDPGNEVYNITSKGGTDVFITSLTSTGDLSWVRTFGAAAADIGSGIAVDASGYIYTVGRFFNTVNFNPDVTGTATNLVAASMDVFVHKMSSKSCTTSTYVITPTACDTFRLNGNAYSASGNYNQLYVNAAGCDSVIYIGLTINKTVLGGNITHAACDSFTYNGTKYTASGAYPLIYTSAAGCDSIVTLTLTINTSTHLALTEMACDSFSLNNVVYKASGTYTQTLVNAAGCDSIITLDLTLGNTNDTIIARDCFAYTWDTATYSQSGVYTRTYTSVNSCDSIVTLSLTIDTVDVGISKAGVVLTAQATGAIYQWVNCDNGSPVSGATNQSYTPDVDGAYAVIVTQNGCSDTSDCVEVAGVSVKNQHKSATIKIYPNPAQASITLIVKEAVGQLAICGIDGQVIKKQTITDTKSIIDISSLANGVYLMYIMNGEGTLLKAEKLVKVK